MEQWEEAVWKRVQPQRDSARQLDVRALELAEGENQAAYRMLLTGLKGSARQTVSGLLATSRENGRILRGLQSLAGGKPGDEKPQPVEKEPAEAMLRGCFYRTQKLQREYTARWTEGEGGCVFQILTERARESCGQIALALGQLNQPF